MRLSVVKLFLSVSVVHDRVLLHVLLELPLLNGLFTLRSGSRPPQCNRFSKPAPAGLCLFVRLSCMPTPTFASGNLVHRPARDRYPAEIWYIDLPATDIPRASKFYEAVCGWEFRRCREGSTAFSHGGRSEWELASPAPPSAQPGCRKTCIFPLPKKKKTRREFWIPPGRVVLI